MSSQLVTKANKLTSASYSLGVAEQRIILLAIIEARSQQRMIDARGVLRIKAKAYQDNFKVEKHTAYEALKSAATGLFEASFKYDDIDDKTGKPKHKVVRWVQQIAYIDEAGTVELQFTDAVIPLITRLSEKYTEYELKQVSELQSEYAIRLYELMMQWKTVGKTNQILLDDLRNQLGVKPDQYQAMNNFKARVLDHAVSQINNHTDITAEYEQHKTGRKVTGFTFRFRSKQAVSKPKQVSNNDFLKMTDKQIAVFSNKLAQLPELGSKAAIGASTDDYANLIANELRDPSQQQKYHKYLSKVGYQPSKKRAS